jgi:hypothetical protein
MAATSTTPAAGLRAPSKPAARIDVMQSGPDSVESPERVDFQIWQSSQDTSADPYLPLISLDENGKPPFYKECSNAIRYSSA